MSIRTPLAHVRGLGTAKDGTHHWWVQRVTSIILVPLVLWFVFSLIRVFDADYETFQRWLSNPYRAGAMVALLDALKVLKKTVGADEFVDEIGEWLTDIHAVDPRRATTAVFHVLSRHLAPGQVEKVRMNLPKAMRILWPALADTPPRRPRNGEDAAAMATGI